MLILNKKLIFKINDVETKSIYFNTKADSSINWSSIEANRTLMMVEKHRKDLNNKISLNYQSIILTDKMFISRSYFQSHIKDSTACFLTYSLPIKKENSIYIMFRAFRKGLYEGCYILIKMDSKTNEIERVLFYQFIT